MLRKNDQTKSIADLCRSDDPRSNPAEVQQFLLSKKLLENERNKLKEWTELAHFFKELFLADDELQRGQGGIRRAWVFTTERPFKGHEYV